MAWATPTRGLRSNRPKRISISSRPCASWRKQLVSSRHLVRALRALRRWVTWDCTIRSRSIRGDPQHRNPEPFEMCLPCCCIGEPNSQGSYSPALLLRNPPVTCPSTRLRLGYSFARRLKTLKGLIPYEYVCRTKQLDRFILDLTHQMPGLNI
jgi:hypothetical protein